MIQETDFVYYLGIPLLTYNSKWYVLKHAALVSAPLTRLFELIKEDNNTNRLDEYVTNKTDLHLEVSLIGK